MVSDDKPPAQAGQSRLSLYANLLDGSATGTISRAPVMFNNQSDALQEEGAKQNAALRFQPTKRPQPAQKPKNKSSAPKTQSSTISTSSPAPVPKHAPISAPKTTIADWTGDDDDINGFYSGEKRQRGGRKKRKKNREEAVIVQDWDDVYDPSRPNIYDEYKHSEEKYREIRDWKDKLYAHRMNRRTSSDISDDDAYTRPAMKQGFAPPSNYSFAPPIFDDEPPKSVLGQSDPSSPQREIPNDASGEDAFARRAQMSQNPGFSIPTLPTAPDGPAETYILPSPKLAPSISRAPVRYQLPEASNDLPSTEAELQETLAAVVHEDANEHEDAADEDAPRSLRPGQKGFAQRLMSKYGWTKGSGLGASGTGIVKPLRVQIDKRKKKSDAEGGGWTGPAGKGKIIGAKQGKSISEDVAEDKGAGLSEVVIMYGMVDGLDLDKELGEGDLMQEIGEECGDKYGRVERVFIDRNTTSSSIPVFVKFTSQLSALRAVQALSGRVFNGNTISAAYYDAEKFEAGLYE